MRPARPGALLPLLVLICSAGLASCQSPSPSPDQPTRILFIGNSLTYTNDLPGMVQALADSSEGPVEVTSFSFPDFSLEDHWNQGDAVAAIRRGGWKYVVMQQGPSSLDESRTSLILWAGKLGAEIRAKDGIPVLYMIWPDETRLAWFDAVRESYRLASLEAGGRFAPAGEAWQSAWRRDQNFPLYGPDRFHPSPEGTYLAALTVFGVIFERSPVGLPPGLRTRNGVTIELDPRTARYYQDAAAEAIDQFANDGRTVGR